MTQFDAFVGTEEQIIDQMCDGGMYSPVRVTQEFCIHEGCIRDAVIEQPDPEGGYFVCLYHATTMERLCEECGEIRVVTNFVSGRSLGGAGTMEVYTYECGHTEYDEDDCLANYV